MSSLDTPTATRSAVPDVFTALLFVATLLLALGVAWMVLVNTDHSTIDSSPGGPIQLVDLK
mgnify:CR=1 FL=1|jgi:hypothetical protein